MSSYPMGMWSDNTEPELLDTDYVIYCKRCKDHSVLVKEPNEEVYYCPTCGDEKTPGESL